MNIGNPDEFTMLQCARRNTQRHRLQLSIVHQPLPQDDPARRCPDIGKARTLLDWQPTVRLREGLKKSLAYFLSCLATQSILMTATDALH